LPFPRGSRGNRACSHYFDGFSEIECCNYAPLPVLPVVVPAKLVTAFAVGAAAAAAVDTGPRERPWRTTGCGFAFIAWIDQFDGFGQSDESSLALAPNWTLAESRDRVFRESVSWRVRDSKTNTAREPRVLDVRDIFAGQRTRPRRRLDKKAPLGSKCENEDALKCGVLLVCLEGEWESEARGWARKSNACSVPNLKPGGTWREL
ncbi:hypothetical protein J3459_018158, partial [Metarhizium acridum]